jgi:hypothetical protein
VIADVDHDGDRDLVVALSNAEGVAVHLQDAAGAFVPAVFSPLTASTPEGIVVVDLNGDGRADLGILHQGSETVEVLVQD